MLVLLHDFGVLVMNSDDAVSASPEPWDGVCLDDGTGRGVYYVRPNGQKTVKRPPNFVPEYLENGDRRYYYRGTLLLHYMYVCTYGEQARAVSRCIPFKMCCVAIFFDDGLLIIVQECASDAANPHRRR